MKSHELAEELLEQQKNNAMKRYEYYTNLKLEFPDKIISKDLVEIGEKEYLLGETTASDIAPGLIAKEYSDTYKWIPVGFN